MKYWLPVLLFILITPWITDLDLAVTAHFYQMGGKQFISDRLITTAYQYGFYPADSVVILSILMLLASFIQSKWRKWRAPALMLALVLIVGSGLIVHIVFKDNWGRPRPKQVVNFGGDQPFRPYYEPNFFHQPEPSRSFPCGHCSTGFFFFALALVGKRMRNKFLASIGWLLAFGLGILLSYIRIAQGGHFLSDTLFSALIMWETALLFDWLIYEGFAMSEVTPS